LENKGKSAFLLIIDLDYLKTINNSHDNLARILTKNILNNSIAARFGSDELVVVIPKTDFRKAAAFAEVIKDNFAEIVRQLDDQDPTL
jgi:diguanylate cyclase (GGDEF)-like protein